MTQQLRRSVIAVATILLAVLADTGDAYGQTRGYSPNLATGERYHVEGSIGTWNPSPAITVRSEQFGILGDEVNAVTDLGVAQRRFPELRLVLRPATKHKFRFNYVPISYTVDGHILEREIVFNGIAYNVGLPVNTTLDWKIYRFGYEYDFIYRDRGFAGFIVDVNYTDAAVELNSPVRDLEYTRARAPVPAIGGIGRVYVASNISVTAEVTGFRLPESIDERYRGRFVDIDVYGTVNLTENFGVQVGYRSLDVTYTFKNDGGAFKFNGLYLAGTARY